MGTASTKSRNTKQRATRPAGPARAATPAAVSEPDIPDLQWRFAALVIVVLGAFLRIYDLNLVPLHHDEGVN